MAEMKWYKVWLVVPGTDGDAENGPCEPDVKRHFLITSGDAVASN